MLAESLGKLRANEEDIVYIGRELMMSYVVAAVTQFNTRNSNMIA